MTERYHPPKTPKEVDRPVPEYDPDELTGRALEQLLRHEEKITHLVGELKEGIEANRWEAILADDRSARLLGRIVRDVAKLYAVKRGGKAPQLFFAAGDGEAWGRRNEDMRAYAKHLKGAIPGRILLLTNVTESGMTLLRMGGALQEAGVPYDIATLIDIREEGYRDNDEEMQYKLIKQFKEDAGAGEVFTASFVRDRTGETEERRDILHSRYDPEMVSAGGVEKRLYGDKAIATRDWSVPQQSINDIREAAEMLAKDIYQEVFVEEAEEKNESKKAA